MKKVKGASELEVHPGAHALCVGFCSLKLKHSNLGSRANFADFSKVFRIGKTFIYNKL